MYVVRPDQSSATAAVELWFRAPGAGYELNTPGIARLAIASVAASAEPHGTSLVEQVNRAGGSLAINVYPDIAMIGVEVPSWDAQSILRAVATAYFSPSVSEAGYRAGLRDCAIAAAEVQYDSARVLQDALFAHLFSEGAAHYSPVPASTQDYTRISVEDVKAFAQRAFRQGNAMLTLTGAVDPAWISQIGPGSANGSRALDAPIDSTLAGRGSDVAQPADVGGIGFAWTGPAITDPKAATAMDFVADYLFDPDRGTVVRAARRTAGDAYVSGQFITLHDPGVLIVTIGGDGASKLRDDVSNAIAALENPLDRGTFEAARNAFVYHILSQIQTPSDRADNFGWYAAEGNLPYAPGSSSGEYLANAEALDPGYIAQVVRQYLQHPSIVELTTAHGEGKST